MWDKETTFSDNEVLVAGDSANIVDLGGDDIGNGTPVYLQVSLSAGASGSLVVNVNTDDDPAMSGAVRVVQYIVPADKVARGGVVLAAPLPSGCKQYVRLSYADASGGRITAGLTLGVQSNGM